MARRPSPARLEGLSTAAVVTCSGPRFEDDNGIPSAGFVTLEMLVLLNGQAGEFGDRVTFARNASSAEKQAAVRQRLNTILASIETGNSLNNANIQIVGLPV